MHFRPDVLCGLDCLRVSFGWIVCGRLVSFGWIVLKGVMDIWENVK